MEAIILDQRNVLIEKVKFQLPEINEFLNTIASIQVSYRGEKGAIKEHVESQVKEIIENKKLPKSKKSRKFLFNLLHSQVKDEVAEQAISALEQEFGYAC